MEMRSLTAYMDAHLDEMVARLRALVEHESPSTDKVYLDRLAEHLAQRWESLGAVVSVLDNPVRGNHLCISLSSAFSVSGAAPILLLGHFDTVWPIGTLVRHPFAVEAGKATGPGVLDMKGGLVIAEFALQAITELALPLSHPVTLMLNSDEEIGSTTSRGHIEAEAASAAAVLVLEPALPSGGLKTARKGVGGYTVTVTGRAAHAGTAPEEGVSAVEELAHQILRLHQITDLASGTTVNVGRIEGGTRPNVIAAEAQARVDLRIWTREEADRVDETIRGLQPFNPATQLSVTGGIERFPMERSEGTLRLFAAARRVGQRLGMTLLEGASGGGSDGNFTAAMGIPTLDGLGAVGDGSHAEHEFVQVASLPQRAALLAALLCGLSTTA
jgi:glutamate carboxypeptidase